MFLRPVNFLAILWRTSRRTASGPLMAHQSPRVVRFGVYAVLVRHTHAVEARSQGTKPRPPSRVLGLLLQNAAHIVTRESLKQRTSFVVTIRHRTRIEQGRSALSDSGSGARTIARVPGRVTRSVLEAAGPGSFLRTRAIPPACGAGRCGQDGSPGVFLWELRGSWNSGRKSSSTR